MTEPEHDRRHQGDDLTGRRGGYKTLTSELHYFFRQIWVVVILIGVVCTGALAGYGLALRHQDDVSTESRDLTCSISRLVSFVPAFQFEGESRENFVGWIQARRDMLAIARDRKSCSPEVIRLLENRVRLDDELLDKLQNSKEVP